MRDLLLTSLFQYVKDNHPDLFFELGDDSNILKWLSDKVSTVTPLVQQLKKKYKLESQILEVCMDTLTKALGPSRYNYICLLLEEEFEATHRQFVQVGILRFEAVNLVAYCRSVFDDLQFSEENEDNRFTRYAIIGTIKEYLHGNEGAETVSYGVQQPTQTRS